MGVAGGEGEAGKIGIRPGGRQLDTVEYPNDVSAATAPSVPRSQGRELLVPVARAASLASIPPMKTFERRGADASIELLLAQVPDDLVRAYEGRP